MLTVFVNQFMHANRNYFFLLKWNTPFYVQSGVYLVVKKCFWILFSWDNNDMQQYDDDLDGMEKTRYNEV